MADDAKQSARRLRLKLALEDLREMKGFGTELVTLIIITIGVGWWGTDSGLTLVGDLAAVEGSLPSLTTPS